MKKRKPPIFLATALLIVVVLGVFVNIAITKQNQTPEEAQAQQQQQQQSASTSPAMDPKGNRPTVTPQQAAANVKSMIGSTPTPPKSPRMDPMGMMGKGRSAIMMPGGSQNKPTPSESSISTHWYEKDSAAGQH
jgi:cytoskeletal protein RodZ